MIRGSVHGLQARVTVYLQTGGRLDLGVECVIDTGFEGALTLPERAVDGLALPYLTDLTANLADNTTIRTAVHLATIVWDGVEKEVAVLVLEGRPLLGTALLEGCR